MLLSCVIFSLNIDWQKPDRDNDLLSLRNENLQINGVLYSAAKVCSRWPQRCVSAKGTEGTPEGTRLLPGFLRRMQSHIWEREGGDTGLIRTFVDGDSLPPETRAQAAATFAPGTATISWHGLSGMLQKIW